MRLADLFSSSGGDPVRLVVESLLPCDADAAWRKVLTSGLLLEVAAPLVKIAPVPGDRLPDVWQEGAVVQCQSFLFGILPLGTRTLRFERIDPANREIQTRESDPSVKRWDHLIRIVPVRPGWCRYRDEIVIEAGWRTVAVWAFAQWFYRHRQRRWRGVTRRLSNMV